jgi:dihydropteroate synthase
MTASMESHGSDHIHFVTGKLAAHALEAVVAPIAAKRGFQYSIGVMPITVAALMTPAWLTKHLRIPSEATQVIVPGYCHGDLAPIHAITSLPVTRGPIDLRQLPAFFGQPDREAPYGDHRIQIIAEINHANRMSIDDVVATAKRLANDGADWIDLGATPGERWESTLIARMVAAVCSEGLNVSIDTLVPEEASVACQAGARLVLSVNSANRHHALQWRGSHWQAEVVAIPDVPDDLQSLDETIQFLAANDIPMRIDPILEPIGLGFTASVQRYAAVRERYPDAPMMMGIGNLTELTDVDSAGVNVLLLGICEELRIDSVLTTQVIPWAQSSVRECDIGRRLVHYAVTHRLPPKRVDDRLVSLRDPRVNPYPAEVLADLARQIKDNNYRVFAQDDQLHLISAGLHLKDVDPFQLFEQLMARPESTNVDAGHAFYLGFELAKALTALTLGKQYQQDEALRWGHLTRPEDHHRLKRTKNLRERTTRTTNHASPIADPRAE